MYWRVKSADPLRRYIPPFILSLHIITLMTRICLAVTFSTTSQYHIANLSSIFVQQISLKISFHSIKSTLYRFLRTPRTNGVRSPFRARETSLSFSIDSDVDYLQWLTASPNFIGYHPKFSNRTSEYPRTHS